LLFNISLPGPSAANCAARGVGCSESLCEKSDFHFLRPQPDLAGIDPCYKADSSVFLPPIIFLLTFHTVWRMARHRRFRRNGAGTEITYPVEHQIGLAGIGDIC